MLTRRSNDDCPTERAVACTVNGRAVGRTSEPAGTSRRGFVKLSCAALAAASVGRVAEAASGGAGSHSGPELDDDRMGVLVDLTLCVGCRRCEYACAQANENPHGALHDYDDTSVFRERRYPSAESFTAVNRPVDEGEDGEGNAVFLKAQCLHCEHPPCASACLVGAIRKDPSGPVVYDASRCIGCRYCMVACPFGNISYEYDKAFTPRVRKCEMCLHRTSKGELPACVEMCPVEALTYGKRSDLLAEAHARIARRPGTYHDHVYGETEGGGTSWLYLADRPFEELGLPRLGPESPAALTEAIQHGVFRGFAAPLILAGLLATITSVSKKKGAHA